MDNIGIANVGIASVAAITVICYLVGLCVKAVPNMADAEEVLAGITRQPGILVGCHSDDRLKR